MSFQDEKKTKNKRDFYFHFIFQAVVDRLKAPTVAIDTERSDQTGGIDIERAKLRMRQEDTVDREIYRQKIKEKHRVSYQP